MRYVLKHRETVSMTTVDMMLAAVSTLALALALEARLSIRAVRRDTHHNFVQVLRALQAMGVEIVGCDEVKPPQGGDESGTLR